MECFGGVSLFGTSSHENLVSIHYFMLDLCSCGYVVKVARNFENMLGAPQEVFESEWWSGGSDGLMELESD